MQRVAVLHDDAPARKSFEAPDTAFGGDFSLLGSVRRAIRHRRIASVVIPRRLLVPLTEV